MPDPITGDMAHDDGLIDPPGCSVVYVFDTGIELQFCRFEIPLQAAVFFPSPLSVDDEPEMFFEGKSVDIRLHHLIFKCLGHADKFQGEEFFDSLLIKHGRPPFLPVHCPQTGADNNLSPGCYYFGNLI